MKIEATDPRQALYDWRDALVSGEYKQGYGALTQKANKKKEMFCCLGVFCEVAIKYDYLEKPHKEFDEKNKLFSYDNMQAFLPSKLSTLIITPDKHQKHLFADTLKIPEPLRSKTKGLSTLSAATLNDAYKFTFKEIATCLEYTYELEPYTPAQYRRSVN